MSPLRKRLIEDLQLAGYSQRTVESYSSVVVRLSQHYGRSPEQISEEELRAFFVHLKTERKLSDSSFKQYATGIKFFFEKTLGQKWDLFDLARPQKSSKLPFVLSHEEVKWLLPKVRLIDCRTALVVIYSCGLRLQECLHLDIGDIDGNRKMLRVQQGKGAKDRYVPIPERTLELLRIYWQQFRPQPYLFPSPRNTSIPMNANRLQKVFKTVVRESKTAHQQASIHTLRHSYATRLLENGVNIKQLQELLGHRCHCLQMTGKHLCSI